MASSDIRAQLERLSIGRDVQTPAPESRRRGPAIEELVSGKVVDTDYGSFFLHRETYALDYRHGGQVLGELLTHSPETAANLARDERLMDVDLRRLAFIDTETTGLAGGTGTYAFLVGVGVFEEDQFTLHQFFMRDYGEEPAQLYALGELLDGLDGVVSFNGKSFDMPLLETRFIMARQPPRLIDAPHLDLLTTARRFWKYRLESCALSVLEPEVLGVERTHEDVPSWRIPFLYTDYARSGDASEMPGIFYHNAQDILSLVTLTSRQCVLLTQPLPTGGKVPGEDLYGLARLLLDLEQPERAEAAYGQSVEACRSAQVREMAMRDLACLLKRQERREEALRWWQRLVETVGAVYACEELAKHYEWHDVDLAQAIGWTQRGIVLAETWPRGAKRGDTLTDLQHRLERLERKRVGESAEANHA
jgi:uncharacterized protein YprB with RNaseH-like and TPR domain